MTAPIQHQHRRQKNSEVRFNAWIDEIQQALGARISLGKKKLPAASFDSLLSTQILGYCGLKSTIQLKAFLDSPAGKQIKTEIVKQLINQDVIHQRLINAERIRLQLRRRAITLILFSKMAAREAQEHRLKEYFRIVTEQQKEEKTQATSLHHLKDSSIEANVDLLMTTIETTSQEIESTEHQLSDLLEETALLEHTLEHIEIQFEQTNIRYALYDARLADIPIIDVPVDPILSDHQQGDAFSEQIEQMKVKLDYDFIAIEKLLETGKPEDEIRARALMDQSNADHLLIQALQDMVDVIKGVKILYTATGERTYSFENARYVLGKNKNEQYDKIIFQDDKYYLVAPSIDEVAFRELKLDDPIRQKAADAYERRAGDIMIMQQLVHRNRELEHHELNKRKTGLLGQLTTNQNTALDLASQLVRLQNQLAKDVHSLNQLNPVPQPGRTKETKKEESFSRIQQKLGDAKVTPAPSPKPKSVNSKRVEEQVTIDPPVVNANEEPSAQLGRIPIPRLVPRGTH